MIGNTIQLKSEPRSKKSDGSNKKSYSFKRIILLELCILFLASAFPSDKNPGWVQQSVPVNKTIKDIFFIDSLRGWAVTDWGNDSISVILNTTNGGTNWLIQYSNYYPSSRFNSMQFVDSMNGYAVGGWGLGIVLKTTNSGINWNLIYANGVNFTDVFFVNKDTGWVCDDDQFFGIGVIKTTNGGQSWNQQLPASYNPSKLFFINRDTGWCATEISVNNYPLMRTTNGGINWTTQYTFPFTIEAIFFLNTQKGWVRDAVLPLSGNGIAYTINGGFNWTNAEGVVCGFDIKFINDSIGYSGISGYHVAKSVNGGKNWYYQSCPLLYSRQIAINKNDTNRAWTGESGIAYTVDGGGPILQIANNNEQLAKDFVLYQNYPNPYNQFTIINVQLQIAKQIKIEVFDLAGKRVKTIINKKESSGLHSYRFDGGNLSSGIYFYSLFVDGVRADTKKMVLIK